MSAPLSKAEIDEINRHLAAATKPNSPHRMLESWSMPIHGGVWLLVPVGGPEQELYRHEIVEYVGMLKAAGIAPAPARSIFNRPRGES